MFSMYDTGPRTNVNRPGAKMEKGGYPHSNEQEARERAPHCNPGREMPFPQGKSTSATVYARPPSPKKKYIPLQSALHTYFCPPRYPSYHRPSHPYPTIGNAMYHGIAVVSQLPTVYSWQGGPRRSLEHAEMKGKICGVFNRNEPLYMNPELVKIISAFFNKVFSKHGGGAVICYAETRLRYDKHYLILIRTRCRASMNIDVTSSRPDQNT